MIKWVFKLWSETKPQAKSTIDPKLGLRTWEKLDSEEKKRIWLHFNNEGFFVFNKTKEDKYGREVLVNKDDHYAIVITILHLKDAYKKQDFAKNYLEDQNIGICYKDFKEIFFSNKNEDVVMEAFSSYAKVLFSLRKTEKLRENEGETNDQYQERKLKWQLEPLESFRKVFNDIFEHFELNYRLTRGGILPYQPRKIIEEIYDPVLEILADEKFKKVDRDLVDAIKEFHKKDKNSYSTCISLCIAAIEEFLRVLILEKSNKAEGQALADLIGEAQRKEVIPNDFFSKQIFSNMKSILMKKRQEKGQAHSKNDYATEKNAKLTLNLTMVFMQHCVENI